ncbi:MAG TPA: hypothetical protein VEQ58_19930, partial [Polyangiaceae bacterium]|nr:hypothetical protein [Polyangiaceae bacterium]
RVAPTELSSGARLSFGIGEQSAPRGELSRTLSALFSGGAGPTLDWLGDFAMVGVADRAELLTASRMGRHWRDLSIERPASAEDLSRGDAPGSDLDMLTSLPVYVVVGLRSRVAAAIALTALEQQLKSAAPGAVSWAPFASHRGVDVVRIGGRERGREIALYYAMAGDNLVVSFNRSVLRSLIEQALDGKLPAPTPAAKPRLNDAQVVLELAPSKKGSLRALLTWALGVAAAERAPATRAAAEAVLRGVPESAHKPERSAELAVAYFGAAPLTQDQRRYWMSPEGIADPLRGTAHAPEWPALPTPESAAERLLTTLSRLRGDLSFEAEPALSGAAPPLRSLRARMDLWLR